MNDEPKRIGLTWPLILITALAAPLIVGMIMIGLERVYIIMLIISSAASVSMVVVSAAFPIRQWRRGEEKPETVREIIKDGTQRVKEIHYGAPPKYSELGQPNVSPWAYPAMVDAAYKAGATGAQQNAYAVMPAREDWNWQDDAPAEATDGVGDVPPPPVWNGDIMM